MTDRSISIEVPINADEYKTIEVEIIIEEIKAQRDVGIMTDCLELLEVVIPDEYIGNRHVTKFLENKKTFDDIQQQASEEYLDDRF